MTPDPSSSLVERVAAAINNTALQAGALETARAQARAAIRVVAEHCAELCKLPAFGVDATAFGDPVKWSRPPTSYEIAKRIRNLIPTPDTP